MDSTKKPLTSVELAKQYGYIGCLIKRIGTTYNQDETSNNNPFPNNITDLIIEFVKDDLFKKIPLEKLTQPPLNFEIPAKGSVWTLACNPIKPEIAVGGENLVLYDIKNGPCKLSVDKPVGKSSIGKLAYSPRGKFLAAIFSPDIDSEQETITIYIWNLTTKQIAHWTDKLKANDMLFTDDETQLVISDRQNIVIWDMSANKLLEASLKSNKINLYLACKRSGIMFGYIGHSSIILWNLHNTSETELINLADQILSDPTIDPCIEGQTHIYNNNSKAACIQTSSQMTGAAYCPCIDKCFFTNLSEDHTQLHVNVLDLHTNSFKQLIRHEPSTLNLFSDNGSKLILLSITSEIIKGTYIDLVPNLNKFTIDQLRVMATKEDIQ
jgi:WD40 repeat protein